jgi:hypothetical protein
MSPTMLRVVDLVTAATVTATIALTIGALGDLLDAHDERQRAAAASHSAADISTAHRQCQAAHGENATAVQLPDGSHRCATKHGRRMRSEITIATKVSAP